MRICPEETDVMDSASMGNDVIFSVREGEIQIYTYIERERERNRER